MRARRGGSRRGKLRTLNLIENWWNEIEGDLARYLHVDARDFIRGTRPWAQFLVYADYIGKIEGGRLWAAQLEDDRFLPLIKERMKEVSKDGKPVRPPLAGYDRVVDGLSRVATEVRLLRADMTRREAEPILGPAFPWERIKEQEQEAEINDLMAAIQQGHKNWEEANARLNGGDR